MAERVFYRTSYTFTVLSDGPIHPDMSFEDIFRECDEGSFVMDYGSSVNTVSSVLTGKEMADALYAAGSDPSFFELNDDGESESEDA